MVGNTKVSQKGRTVVGRLLPGVDLLEGLVDICKSHKIKSGAVLSLIGSLAKARYIYAVPDEENIIGIRYSDPLVVQGPLEFLSGQGTIGMENDQVVIHLHGLLCDTHNKICGGHFIGGGNPVLATMEVVIQEFADVKVARLADCQTGFSLFKYFEK